MLSIIIPTYNEKANVRSITHIINRVLKDTAFELIFVDDSDDETPMILSQLSLQHDHVSFIHRQHERGLGTAVVQGFHMAKGAVLAVLDGDLQHPPQLLIPMLEAIHDGADLVVASRFIPGGGDGGLNLPRKLISFSARSLASGLLQCVRSVSDSTSGFFMLRKEVVEDVSLQPIGWKILIEILARGTYRSVIEIPYQFQARPAGESKMSCLEQINYMRHLLTLFLHSPHDRRFLLFASVGMSGLILNMCVFAVLVHLQINVVTAGFISATCAMLSNFILNNIFTWGDVGKDPLWIHGLRFLIISACGIGINMVVLAILYYSLDVGHLHANLLGIGAAVMWNYYMNNHWNWAQAAPSKALFQVQRWDIDRVNQIMLLQGVYTDEWAY